MKKHKCVRHWRRNDTQILFVVNVALLTYVAALIYALFPWPNG